MRRSLLATLVAVALALGGAAVAFGVLGGGDSGGSGASDGAAASGPGTQGEALTGGEARAGGGARASAEREPEASAVNGSEPEQPDGGGPVRFNVSVSGDLLMHSPLLDRAKENAGGRGYDFTPFFHRIAPHVEKVDLALCHLETPLGPGPPSSYPIFNTPKQLARAIHRSGWDGCSTASNHSLDGGMPGIRGTAGALDRADVEHTGSFPSRKASRRTARFNVRGVKLGYLAYTDATNGLAAPSRWALNEYSAADPKAGAKAIIRDARRLRDKGADAVIVNVHWGDEYASSPNSSQMSVARKLTGAKVITAVVGQGPHVVQPIRWINGKPVVFSEGNLVSNQSAAAGLPAATQDGIVALLRFERRGAEVRVKSVEYAPVWVRPVDYVVLPATPGADRSHASELRASRRRTLAVVGRDGPTKPIR